MTKKLDLGITENVDKRLCPHMKATGWREAALVPQEETKKKH